MGATQEELSAFRKELKELGIDKIREDLLHERYGAPDRWKRKEAEEFVKNHDNGLENKNKTVIIEEAKRSNQLQEKANNISCWALGISILALIISIIVAIYK